MRPPSLDAVGGVWGVGVAGGVGGVGDVSISAHCVAAAATTAAAASASAIRSMWKRSVSLGVSSVLASSAPVIGLVFWVAIHSVM